jgi:hyperosmotically inducible protein
MVKTLLPALLSCALGLSPALMQGQTKTDQPKPDNTRVNQRDRNPGEVTADQQKENPADRDLTSKVRKAITGDKTLSTYAHNVKVISENGTVTLKGPVRTEEEAQALVAKAAQVAGGTGKVVNELSVAPKEK